MKVIPIIKCRNLEESLIFYTHVLDFKIHPDETLAHSYFITIKADTAEIQLSASEGVFGNQHNIRVDHIERRFRKYRSRGLLVNPNF